MVIVTARVRAGRLLLVVVVSAMKLLIEMEQALHNGCAGSHDRANL